MFASGPSGTFFLSEFGRLVAPMVIFAASILLARASPRPIGPFLAIGAGLFLIKCLANAFVFHQVIGLWRIPLERDDSTELKLSLWYATNFAGSVGLFLFAIGFFLLARSFRRSALGRPLESDSNSTTGS